MEIRTNHQFRSLIYGYQLTDKEKAEFEYIPVEDIDNHGFFRYKRRVYDLWEAVRCSDESLKNKGWQGYVADGFFSGIVIRLSKDGERVKIGQYFS